MDLAYLPTSICSPSLGRYTTNNETNSENIKQF